MKRIRIEDKSYIAIAQPINVDTQFTVTNQHSKRYGGTITNTGASTYQVQTASTRGYFSQRIDLEPGNSIEIRDYPLSWISFILYAGIQDNAFLILAWASKVRGGFVRKIVQPTLTIPSPLPISGNVGILGQPIGVTVSNFPASPYAVNITEYLNAAVGPLNPMDVKVSNFPATYDVSDRTARILGRLTNGTVPISSQTLLANTGLVVAGNLTPLLQSALGLIGDIQAWGGMALTARDISLDLKVLRDTEDTHLANALVTRTEAEYALGQSKLFGKFGTPNSGVAQNGALRLSNPAGSGITVRVKQAVIYTALLDDFYFFFDSAVANLGAAAAGNNLKRGGAAASSTVAVSNNAGAFPALAGALFYTVVAATASIAVPLNIQLDANHTLEVWQGVANRLSGIYLQWEEF